MKKRITAILTLAVVTATTLLAGCSTQGGKKQEPAANEVTLEKPQFTETNLGTYSLVVDADTSQLDESYDISELLYGIFLEDINYAVDGGLYAEMIKNRSFEYSGLATAQRKHGWTNWGSDFEWSVVDGTEDESYLNSQNTHYAVLTMSGDGLGGISNKGFLDGNLVINGATYNASLFLKALDGYSGSVTVSLKNITATETYASQTIESITDQWWKYELALVPENVPDNESMILVVEIEKGSVAVDMISLFPEDTYNNRENGLRADIVEMLAALEPKFIRFPGGCVIEGKTLDSAYNWKASIGNGMEFMINGETTVGDVAVREQGIDIWADLNATSTNPYYMTYGCGFYEYFLLCEDLGALAIPILNAGLSCEIQGVDTTGTAKEILDVDSDEFKQYVQDALDLVEFCRGGADTKWGAVRIAMGHEAPFDLKYVGIGNEQWSETYFAHYAKFAEAFAQAADENPEMYGDIELIVANGPNADSKEGWTKVRANAENAAYAGLVDEHYYCEPSWFLNNLTRYDNYDRDEAAKVFLGEYAAKSNTLEAALAEAAYMTGIERNADIIEMACYAPLFGNSTANQWTPDMIWFSRKKVFGSVNYYVQKIFSTNQGTQELISELDKSIETDQGLRGCIGLGTWSTSATFDNLKIQSMDSDEVFYEEDFTNFDLDSLSIQAGNFSEKDGKLVQSNTEGTKNELTGDTAFLGDTSWNNYMMTVTATKTGGAEGFIIPVCVTSEGDFIFWNLGGWGNTVSCLQIVSNGSKSGQVEGTVSDMTIQTGREYEISITVRDNVISCYLDKKKVITYTYEVGEALQQVCSIDKNGDMIIKLVNTESADIEVDVILQNAADYSDVATLQVLQGDSLSAENTFENPENVVIEESELSVGSEFTYVVPKYSVSVIRIPKE